MEARSLVHPFKRMRIICLVIGFLSLQLHAQKLSFNVVQYELNTPLVSDQHYIQAKYDAKGSLQGKIRDYRINRSGDTIVWFRAMTQNGRLVDTAYWYDHKGNIVRKVFFVLPQTGESYQDNYLNIADNLFCVNGVQDGEDKQWKTTRDGKYYTSSIERYVKGKREGPHEQYHNDGTLLSRVMYNDDMKHGACEFREKNGNIVTGHYERGRENGTWEYYTRGKLEKQAFYNNDDHLDSVYVLSLLHGYLSEKLVIRKDPMSSDHYLYYDDMDGRITRSYYFESNGQRDSISITYHVNGKMESRVNYDQGSRNGLYQSWYPNGKTYQEYTYKNGSREGLYTSRYENGKLKATGNYRDGQKTGKWIHYRNDGSIMIEPDSDMQTEEEDPLTIEGPRETVEAVIEQPLFHCTIKLPQNTFFSGTHVQDKKDRMGFMSKYPEISLMVWIDRLGGVSFQVLSPMKEKDSDRLVEYLNANNQLKNSFMLNNLKLGCKVLVRLQVH